MNIQDLMNRIHEIVPGAQLGEDNDGQIVIYTGLQQVEFGELIDMDEEANGDE